MERFSNRALAYSDLEEFVAAHASISAPRPPTVEHVVELNRGPFLGAPAPLAPLERFEGQVLDVRTPQEFAAGHVAAAINVPVSGSSVGTKAGFLLDPDRPIALHAASPEQAEEGARRLRAVGLLDLAGYLSDADETERLEPVTLEELEALLANGAVEVIDVREKEERDEGYIPESRHIPYRLLAAYVEELDNGRPVVTVCESGARAAVAASVLAAHGIPARPVLDTGISDWERRGNPITAFRRCGSG
jgi:rhodanese-related sulfurtransferase